MEPIILVVEDSQMYGKLLERTITNHLGFRTVWLQSYLETEEYLQDGGRVTLALLDYTLPDALDGEIIDLCADLKVPTVVITSNLSDDLQEFLWSKRILDYVIKEGAHAINYILDVIERFVKNPQVGVLVVDDSKVARKHMTALLEPYHFQLFQAENGEEALEILHANRQIKLVLTDYAMPVCDGFELTRRIRQIWPIEKLAVIGLSAKGSHQLAVKFIKFGANDFLNKPFLSEMLMCRINQNLTLVEHFESLRELSHLDHLTNVSNRRYLFEAGDIIFENARRTGDYPVVAMMDLDHFKVINDKYGHVAGDKVLATIAGMLKMNMRKSDILSRYGGEEFCLICRNMDSDQVKTVFDKWRQMIADTVFDAEGVPYSVTVSIGLCVSKKDSFLAMIEEADRNLYKAKQAGRNRISLGGPE